ncbi:MAG: site-2 protease family protein [Chloroflexi bacterium]|nr:site-2 protease family protein [Chloroflexota bacterium]MBU1661878.1 site-2 protease family protein [Chloroflexota bacterium]
MFDLNPATLIARILVLLTAFSVHEFAHAWMADYFGDDTPRINGRLTLNPMAHLDPMGSLMLILAGFGWAKPVPVNPYALRRHSPSAMMWVALAGPLSNFVMAIVAAIPFRLGLFSMYDAFMVAGQFLPTLPQLLVEFVYINLVLMLFNLIPLAPLDGEKVVDYFLPPSGSDFLASIRPYGPMILLLLFIAGPYLGINILGWILGPPIQFLFNILMG